MVEVPYNIPDEHLVAVYNWIDEISFSRRRKDISRDFSDGVLCAELIAKFLPRLVDLHNYTPSCSTRQKTTNWDTLNRKVLSKLGIIISTPTVRKLVESRPGTIEQVLFDLKKRVEEAVLMCPHMCIFTPTSSAIATSCIARPPSAKFIGENRPVSAKNLPKPSKRQQNGPLKRSVEFQQPEIQQQMPKPTSIPSKLSPSAQSQHLSILKPPPASTQVQVQQVLQVQVQPSVPAKASMSPASSTLQISQSKSGPGQGQAAAIEIPKKISKIIPMYSVNSDDEDYSTDDNDEDIQFRKNMMLANIPAQILHNQRKVAKCFEEKEKHIQYLQGEITNVHEQLRRFKTLIMVKDRRINDLSHQLSALTQLYNKLTKSAGTGVGVGDTGK